MEKIFYAYRSPFIFLWFIIFLYIMSLTLLLFNEYLGTIVMILLNTLLLLLPLILLRKRLFCKILLDEKNISVIFKNKVIKTFSWSEVKFIRRNYYGTYIVSRINFNSDKDMAKNEKDIITMHVTTQSEQALKEFSQFYDEKIIQF